MYFKIVMEMEKKTGIPKKIRGMKNGYRSEKGVLIVVTDEYGGHRNYTFFSLVPQYLYPFFLYVAIFETQTITVISG